MSDEELKNMFDTLRQDVKGDIGELRQEMRQEFGTVRQEMAEGLASVRQEMARGLGSVRQEMAQGLDGLRQEMAQGLDGLRQEMRAENAAAHAETRRYVQVLLENDTRVQALAEAVLQVDDRLTRETADIRQEMRTGFAETQAMIKFSHAELDRRITALEQRSA